MISSPANALNTAASGWIRTVLGAQRYAPAKAALICSRQISEDRILALAEVFAIDVCAYAVMSNHHHLVLHINKPKAFQWSNHEVCERWHQLYKGTWLTQKYLRNDPLTDIELQVVNERLDLWRIQLCDISWFMRALNEPVARMANAEDQCTGRTDKRHPWRLALRAS
jgi:hypothetical protein